MVALCGKRGDEQLPLALGELAEPPLLLQPHSSQQAPLALLPPLALACQELRERHALRLRGRARDYLPRTDLARGEAAL